jgi:ISChy4, transposition helper protein
MVYLRLAALVIDEIGYSQLIQFKAELFSHLTSERYEHGSVILTSNKHFSSYEEITW